MDARPALAGAAFVLAAIVSLGASAVLVTRVERLGARWGVGAALLGLLAALCADAPEITSSVTAVSQGSQDVGAGVVFGSNIFNLAALIGLSALVAGRCRFHRPVVLLTGGIGIVIAAAGAGTAAGWVSPIPGLVVALVALLVFSAGAAMPAAWLARLPGPPAVGRWFSVALREEAEEVAPAVAQPRGAPVDALVAGLSLVVVVGASTLMEITAVALGQRWHVHGIVVGGVVLAAVTSLPNAVAAVYLAQRGRAAAVLSEAFNSNSINIVGGLLVPAVVVGGLVRSADGRFAAEWALGLTVAVALMALAWRGIGRAAGMVVIAGYVTFVAIELVR